MKFDTKRVEVDKKWIMVFMFYSMLFHYNLDCMLLCFRKFIIQMKTLIFVLYSLSGRCTCLHLFNSNN